jgi:hypothetical protein
MGPFGLGNGAFDSYMIDLPVIVCAISWYQNRCWNPRNCEDCATGGEGVRLFWRLMDLWQMWWWRVGSSLDMRIGVVRHWVCNLWHCRRICYLWGWPRLSMVGCGIVI